MNRDVARSDALVFFGATGDLARKKVFPALQALVKCGKLDVPVVGVARSVPDLAALRARAHESLESRGSVDPVAFEKLAGLMPYVRGDNSDPAPERFAARRPARPCVWGA